MLPDNLDIIGIDGVDFDPEIGLLRLRMRLSDGSVAAAYWETTDLRRFMGVITKPTHYPAGASLQ